MTQYAIHIVDSGETYTCTAEQSLLHGMTRLGRKGIPAGCYGGGCGVCKVQILDGDYHTRKMSRAQVTEQEEREGYVLACRTFPDSDLRLQVVGKLHKALTR